MLQNSSNHQNSCADMSEKREWNVSPSKTAMLTFNPIRAIVDGMNLQPNPDKAMIPLALGDPTVFGNLPPPAEAVKAIEEAVQSGSRNGYSPSCGYADAREAVAQYLNIEDGVDTSSEDVFLASGCSNALEIAISVLVNPGENILIPRPGFSLYKTLCGADGITVKSYDCLPHNKWEADLGHMESLIDELTRAIVVVNPSNPCGSNFSKKHVRDIMTVAEKFKVPVIADEIYAGLVFDPLQFTSCASQTKTVPVLTCGGISKRFLVPGWRLGWVVMHDRNNVFGPKIRDGMMRLTQRILGPSTLVQATLPKLLVHVDQSFHDNVMSFIQTNADHAFNRLAAIKGLDPVKPEAAFYMMVGISLEHYPDFQNDVQFTETMVSEQSVFCLPAQCFDYPNYFRIVLTVPEDKMTEACDRIEEFCLKYYKP